MKLNFNMGKLKGIFATAIASGKKNAPTIMTAGSVALGWTGVYFFWKESKKADQKIEAEEERLGEKLPFKEKLLIYAEYCWPSAAMGITSTCLAVAAERIDASRIAELALMTQVISDKSEKQQTLINKFKEEIPEKKVREIQQDIYHEEEDEEEIVNELKMMIAEGDTRALIKDRYTGKLFKRDITKVVQGIDEFNTQLRKRRSSAMRREFERHKDSIKQFAKDNSLLSDPFFAASDPWTNKEVQERLQKSEAYTNSEVENLICEIEDVYSTGDVADFLYSIGETCRPNCTGLGEVLEFRCFGDEPAVPQSILKYDTTYRKKYFDNDPNVPQYCVMDYLEYAYPTHEFVERDML